MSERNRAKTLRMNAVGVMLLTAAGTFGCGSSGDVTTVSLANGESAASSLGPQIDYSNQCPDREFNGSVPDQILLELREGPTQMPEGYVDLWDSDDGVLHMGVSGDPGPTQQFLQELGIADDVCVVTGFPYPDEVLAAVQDQVNDAAGERYPSGTDEPLVASFLVSRRVWEGAVVLEVPEASAELRAQLEEISKQNQGVPIRIETGIKNSDPPSDDTAPAPKARCGSVEFSSAPPNLDEFPAVDDEARTALDSVPSETDSADDGLAESFEWSVAYRTENDLVLFGQSPDNNESFFDIRFERKNDRWSAAAWGPCQIEPD